MDSAYSIIPGPQANFPPYVLLAYERVGDYTVTVESAGYEDWERNNIEVGETEFGCHVETEEIETGLDPVLEG